MTTQNEAIARARHILQPTAEAAAEAWRTLVRAEREQVERLPNRPRPEDFYAPVAQEFRADALRTGEPLLDHLRSLVRADETWLDIGAGGGRYTLPLALLAKRMYAVEPSEGMRDVLNASAAQEGVANLDIFDERWPCDESAVPVADVGFISQVGYDIEEFGGFLDQLEAHSSRLCVAVMYERSPIAYFAPLWPQVHHEERVLLPGLGEVLALLFARGRTPEVRGFYMPSRVFKSKDELHAAARRPLWVREDSLEDKRLVNAVEALAQPVDDSVALDPRERYLGVVSWRPR